MQWYGSCQKCGNANGVVTTLLIYALGLNVYSWPVATIQSKYKLKPIVHLTVLNTPEILN